MSTFFQLRTVLNNIQELISSCSKQPLTLHTGPPWTVWAARMGGGRSLSRRLTTTARKWLSSGSTSNLSTSTGLVFSFMLSICLQFSSFSGRCFSNWSRWRIYTTTISRDGLGHVSRRVSCGIGIESLDFRWNPSLKWESIPDWFWFWCASDQSVSSHQASPLW